MPCRVFVGVDTYEDLETPWIKFTLYSRNPPAVADAHFCRWPSPTPTSFPFSYLLARGSEIFHLQTVVCFGNGSAGFPELPVPFFLVLGCVLSWNMILHCVVCFGDIGTKPKEWFYTPLLLLCAWDGQGGSGTWYLCGGLLHFRGTRLFVWPCVWCHTGTFTAQLSMETIGSFCMGCAEHQLFLLPVEMEEGQGAPHVYMGTWWLLLPCPSYLRCFPDLRCICVLGVLLNICDLCNWMRRSSLVLYSMKNSISQFFFCGLALELHSFRTILLFLQSSGWCNYSHICGSWSVNLTASNNLVIFHSEIVHRKYCVL